ncbi:MAG: shikimate kinase [Acidimicrobiia bacterium]|nr:shikimate kinase [Acidimicrobiia bacterium]
MLLWLIGMMGAGKSEVGSLVARQLDVPHFDTDDEVIKAAGQPIRALWNDEGEPAFRAMEAAQVTRLAALSDAVISTGGGVVLSGVNVAAMRASGTVIWLKAHPDRLAARIGSGADRPLLTDRSPAGALATILEERSALYAAAAHRTVETDDLTGEDVARKVAEAWRA